jgi:hypothetical protein
MTLHVKRPPAGGADGPLELSFPGGNDHQASITSQAPKQAKIVARLRRQRLIAHLHKLGVAPLAYFLREVEAGASIPDHLERYARIDPEFVRALGGDRFGPSLWPIDGGGR